MEKRAPMVGPKMKPREKDTPTKAWGGRWREGGGAGEREGVGAEVGEVELSETG